MKWAIGLVYSYSYKLDESANVRCPSPLNPQKQLKQW